MWILRDEDGVESLRDGMKSTSNDEAKPMLQNFLAARDIVSREGAATSIDFCFVRGEILLLKTYNIRQEQSLLAAMLRYLPPQQT